MRTALMMTALLYTSLLSLSGCSIAQLPFVYHPPLEQGTVLSKDKIALLRPGMTPQQVQFLLGTPTIQDPFHAKRWDYVYLRDTQDGKPSTWERLTLFFDASNHLQAAQGYGLPTESPLRHQFKSKAHLSAR